MVSIQVGTAVTALRGKHGQMRPELRNVGCVGVVLDKIQDASGEYFSVEFYNGEYLHVDHISEDCLEVL